MDPRGRRADHAALEAVGVADLERDRGDVEVVRGATQGTVAGGVVDDDLRALEHGHLPHAFVAHVGADVVAVDAPEAGRVQVEQVVEVPHDAVDEPVGVDLADVAVGAAGHDVVEVGAVDEAPLPPHERGDVDPGYADEGAAQLPRVELGEELLDDGDAVELVAVYGGRDPDDRAVAAGPARDDKRDVDRGAHPVGDHVEVVAADRTRRGGREVELGDERGVGGVGEQGAGEVEGCVRTPLVRRRGGRPPARQRCGRRGRAANRAGRRCSWC